MFSRSPSRSRREAEEIADLLIGKNLSTATFHGAIRHLHSRFNIYASTSLAPLPAPDLIVTPEIRYQSELYLPIAEIFAIFNRLYRTALTYPPIVTSTPFYNALSWADVFSTMPKRFQYSTSPARLLEALLHDRDLLTEFLFASFLPRRFYGGFGRYPGQAAFLRDRLALNGNRPIRCLDAACGTGEDCYGLAKLLLESGFETKDFRIEGWTVEPLEVWSAAYGCFPHDPERELAFRRETAYLFEQRAEGRIMFRVADLLQGPPEPVPAQEEAGFDVILCNGLLGGPILHEMLEMEQLVETLAKLLAPGGVLLIADRFHGGWKRHCPQLLLRRLLEGCGLKVFEAGEGIGGTNRDLAINQCLTPP